MKVEVRARHITFDHETRTGEQPTAMFVDSIFIEGKEAAYKKAAVQIDGRDLVTIDIEGLIVSDLKVNS